MNKICYFLLMLFLIFLPSRSWAKPPIFVESYQDAQIITNDIKMPIVIIFSASWCKYCYRIKQDIMDNMDLFEDTIICIIDIDLDQSKKLVKEFRVKKIPKMVLFDSNGKKVNEIIGYTDIKKLQIK